MACSLDVVALAGTPSSVCAAVLRFREGRLTDKREFLFHDTSDIDAVREEFLPRYYLDDEQIPKIIAVDALPPDMDALQQALNQKRGSEVQLYVPQRGDKAHLVEMAHTNAVERLAREENVPLVDVRGAFLDYGHLEQTLCADGTHPNTVGQGLITKAFQDFGRGLRLAGQTV